MIYSLVPVGPDAFWGRRFNSEILLLYCINCGLPAAEGDFYCFACGRLLNAPPVDFAKEPPEEPQVPVSTDGDVPWRGGQVALGMLLILTAIFPVVGVSIGLGKLAGDFEGAVNAWGSSQLMGVAILAAVWGVGLKPYGAPLSSLGLTVPAVPGRKTILWILGALGTSLLATYLYSLLVDLSGVDILMPPDIPTDIVFPGLGAIFTFQALALWTPFTEEIFFRGFVFAGLVPRWGVARAMVASALVFSLFHLSLGLIVPTFITGMLLAWLYQRTGSLWPAIVAHAGQNTLALVATTYGV